MSDLFEQSTDLSNGLLFERRSKPRVYCTYPAVVRGFCLDGTKFQSAAILANLSVIGMYLRMRQLVQLDDLLVVQVRLTTAPLGETSAPHVIAQGRVVRVEAQPDGGFGVAIALSSYRLL
jgi:hypothetical protein